MNKRQQAKFERALAQFSTLAGVDAEALKENIDMEALYTEEDNAYEAQSVINFFEYRIKPLLEKERGESEKAFEDRKEAAYREWKIRVCLGCDMPFAYAYNYEGVKYCSLYCLDTALEKLGLQVTRGRDLRKRWGVQYHPAVVPSSAFQALQSVYEDTCPTAFSPDH